MILTMFLRFIDNIFFIWTGSKGQPITFLNSLNTKHMEIYIKNNKLYTKIYRKKTRQTKLFAYQFKAHYIIKSSIPYSQLLRLRHICSKIQKFMLYCSEWKQKLVEKGYKFDLPFQQSKKLGRNEMLHIFNWRVFH